MDPTGAGSPPHQVPPVRRSERRGRSWLPNDIEIPRGTAGSNQAGADDCCIS